MMTGILSKFTRVFKKYPMYRGMLSYAFIWPTSSLVQQTFEGKTFENYDWMRCGRFCLYGSCFVAPTLYSWLTVASIMWPGSTIRAGLIKAIVEQVTYTPLAMCSFYFIMSVLEGRPFNECISEVSAKFLPTYKIGVCIWPVIAMVNFCLIPPRNRVPFISCCSLVWTCFLAYMKHLEKDKFTKNYTQEPIKIINLEGVISKIISSN